MVNAQEWLESQEKYNTKKKRAEIKKLDISGWDHINWQTKSNWEKLTGNLDLSDFVNLEKLYFAHNQITELDLSNCYKLVELHCFNNKLREIKFTSLPNLQVFYAWNNYLTKLNWDGLNPKILTKLSLSNNNFAKQNLSFIASFVNLTEIYLGNDAPERIEKGIKNRFVGSLESLKELTKLEILQVEGLDVVEMNDASSILPNVKKIICWDEKNRALLINKLGLNEEETQIIRTSNREKLPQKLSEIAIDRFKEAGIKLTTEKEQEIKDKTAELAISTEKSSEEDLEVKLNNFYEQLWAQISQISLQIKQNPQEVIREIEKKSLLEKLDSVHDNMKDFVDSWRRKNPDLLKTPNQLEKRENQIAVLQWSGRFAAAGVSATGGVLSLTGRPIAGGSLTAGGVIFPLIELLSTQIKKSVDEDKKTWENFEQDVENLGKDYCGLIKLLFTLNNSNYSVSSEIDFKLKELSDRIYQVLEECNDDDDKEITLEELEEAKDKLPEILRNNWEEKKSKIRAVMKTIQELKKKINDVREEKLEALIEV
jgi:hypothetical protein